MTVDRDPGPREGAGSRLGPEPLAALLTVGGLILFVGVLLILITR